MRVPAPLDPGKNLPPGQSADSSPHPHVAESRGRKQLSYDSCCSVAQLCLTLFSLTD